MITYVNVFLDYPIHIKIESIGNFYAKDQI